MRVTRSPVLLLRLRTALISLLLGAGFILALPASAASAFPDVPSNHPYVSAIAELSARGIIGGYTNGNFGPEDLVKRQQFAKMIVLTMGFQTTEADICTFKDVLPTDSLDPLYPDHYIAVAARTGLTTGYPDNTFRPYNQITRQQVITMVVRAGGGDLETPPADWVGVLNYSDATHGANIRKAEFNHLLDGLVDLSYSWDAYANASRGECARLLYNLIFLQDGGPGHFESLGGEFTSGPGVCEHNPQGSGGLIMFARGSDNALWSREYWEGTWYSWSSVGEVLTSDPATVTRGSVWGGVFWRGTDNAIWYKGWKDKWLAPHSLGGTFASGPSVAMMTTSRIDVFARGTDNALWHNTGTGVSTNWSWSGWESLGGALTSDTAAVSWGPDRIDVFARGTDNGLLHMSWNGSAWSEWENLGGIFTSGPGVASWGSGRLDVFMRGPSKEHGLGSLWHKSYSGAWSSWENLGGIITSNPDAVSVAVNSIDVFARGSDNALWHTWWDGSAWRP